MSELTQKQVDARAYHAKNADKINARKRDSYGRKVTRGKSIIIAPSKHRKSKAVEHRTQPALSRAEDILDEIRAAKAEAGR